MSSITAWFTTPGRSPTTRCGEWCSLSSLGHLISGCKLTTRAFEEKVDYMKRSVRLTAKQSVDRHLRVSEATHGNYPLIREGCKKAPRSVPGLCAPNHDAARFIIVECTMGCESIERHPVPQ